MDFTHEGRILTLRDSLLVKQKAASAVLFYGSLIWYLQTRFRVNRNIPLLIGFGATSYIAAGVWGRVLLLPVVQEAAILNNDKEATH